MLITANQPFGEWGKVFPDQAMTLAAIDRLVHHATILEMNVESYRRNAAHEHAQFARPSNADTPIFSSVKTGQSGVIYKDAVPQLWHRLMATRRGWNIDYVEFGGVWRRNGS